jgi:hypothetical protein
MKSHMRANKSGLVLARSGNAIGGPPWVMIMKTTELAFRLLKKRATA